METTKHILPAIWASYLINYDCTGLELFEIAECDIETVGLGTCIEVSDNNFFGQFKGIGHDLTEYTFRKD